LEVKIILKKARIEAGVYVISSLVPWACATAQFIFEIVRCPHDFGTYLVSVFKVKVPAEAKDKDTRKGRRYISRLCGISFACSYITVLKYAYNQCFVAVSFLKANKIRGHQKLLSSKHKPGLSRYFA
jgi:hypothetical protein